MEHSSEIPSDPKAFRERLVRTRYETAAVNHHLEPGKSPDGVHPAGTEECECRLVSLAELEHIDGSEEVVLDDLSTRGLPDDPRDHARVGGGVDQPIDSRQSFEIGDASNVTVDDPDSSTQQVASVHLRARPAQVVEADELDTLTVLEQPSSYRTAHETARPSDEHSHVERAVQQSTISTKTSSSDLVIDQSG